MSGILSSADIEAGLRDGTIIIAPYQPSQLSNCSYDVTLGSHYFVEKDPMESKMEQNNGRVSDAGMAGSDAGVGGGGSGAELNSSDDWPVPADSKNSIPIQYSPEWVKPTVMDGRALWSYREAKNGYIILEPGQTILGHTQEFIGSFGKITTKLQARSTVGRFNISICLCAGMGDIGYFNRWTLEIKNHSRHHRICLPVGTIIGQIIFEATISPPLNPYPGGYNMAGVKPAKLADLTFDASLPYAQELAQNWSPDLMLPRKLKVSYIM